MTLLAWQRAGTPATSRPAAVLIHGWAGHGTQWETAGWAAGLASAGFDVLVPDLPGHGASASVHIPDGASPAAWTAHALLADLDRLHVKQIAVVAYADACPVAGHVLVRAPEMVVRAVFIGCDDRVRHPQAAEAARALRDPNARVWQVEAAELVRPARADSRHDVRSLARWLEENAWPAAPRLGALKVPVLFAVGTEDSHRARAPRLAALFSDARLVTASGDDRTVLSAPALVDMVVTFLKDGVQGRDGESW
jgi:pimeloyl-ACP methyl ester carboxylesterase